MDGYSGTQFAGGGFITNRSGTVMGRVCLLSGCSFAGVSSASLNLHCSQEAGAAPASTPQQAKKNTNNQTLRAVTVKQLVDVSRTDHV